MAGCGVLCASHTSYLGEVCTALSLALPRINMPGNQLPPAPPPPPPPTPLGPPAAGRGSTFWNLYRPQQQEAVQLPECGFGPLLNFVGAFGGSKVGGEGGRVGRLEGWLGVCGRVSGWLGGYAKGGWRAGQPCFASTAACQHGNAVEAASIRRGPKMAVPLCCPLSPPLPPPSPAVPGFWVAGGGAGPGAAARPARRPGGGAAAAGGPGRR